MKIEFYTTENMSLFWSYTKMLLQGISPGIMLVFAVVCVGLLLGIVVRAWKKSARDLENEDEIEYREY